MLDINDTGLTSHGTSEEERKNGVKLSYVTTYITVIALGMLQFGKLSSNHPILNRLYNRRL